CSAAADEAAIPQPATAITTKSAPQPFGLDAKPIVGGTVVAKWSGVEAEIRAETEVLSQCRQGVWCPQAALRFLSIVDEGRSLTGRARVGVINRAVNLAIVPTSDWSQWGVADHWSTDLPALFLFAEIIDEGKHQIDQPARYQRIGKVDEQVMLDEKIE